MLQPVSVGLKFGFLIVLYLFLFWVAASTLFDLRRGVGDRRGGIVAGDATGIYQGKVVVQPGAQKTDGAMKSQAILLSPHAVMNNKPELEIFADDVVCGHGATVGALDPEQLFYLQARGLPKAEAEAMLLEAFGADAIARVDDGALAELLHGKMRAWLAARG